MIERGIMSDKDLTLDFQKEFIGTFLKCWGSRNVNVFDAMNFRRRNGAIWVDER
jgi:hypothetical protein